MDSRRQARRPFSTPDAQVHLVANSARSLAMPQEPKLWIVISRPDRLPNALVAADALRERFPGGSHLLREESKWWENANWREFVRDFSEVHAFPKVKTCRGLKDLPRLYRENVDRQRGVGALPIDPDNDILLCLAGLLGLGNAALSAHPDVFKIMSASQKAFGELTRHGDRARFRFTTSGWLQNRVVEPLAGVERTIHYKPRINPGGDGVRLRRLQKDPEELFDVIIFMSNSGGELPARAEHQIIPSRFPSVAEIEAVYSVSSTVSRTALNNGLNSYALWRCLPFSETQTKFFGKVMGDVPAEFEISDLTMPPVAYQDRKSPVLGQNSFSNALNRAVDLKGR